MAHEQRQQRAHLGLRVLVAMHDRLELVERDESTVGLDADGLVQTVLAGRSGG
jgi:hypothetical protein